MVIREVGFAKILTFLLYSLVTLVYPFLFLPPLRKLFLQILGAKIGEDTVIMNVMFFNWHHLGPKGLTIGKDCFIGDEVLIDLYDAVKLENQVTIAQRVTILTHLNVGYKDHPLQKYFPKSSKPIVVKKGSVIGAASTVLPGVVIGQGSFVAAGSVVTKSIPNRVLAAGVPVKVIRKIK